MATSRTIEQFESSNLQTEQTNSSTAPSPQQAEDSKVYKCLLVFAGFMAMFQVIGINTSYGVFQAYYTSSESFLPPNTPQSAIAFVGTLGMSSVRVGEVTVGYGLSWALGVFISPFMAKDERAVRLVSCGGAAVMSLGIILASFSSNVTSPRIPPFPSISPPTPLSNFSIS